MYNLFMNKLNATEYRDLWRLPVQELDEHQLIITPELLKSINSQTGIESLDRLCDQKTTLGLFAIFKTTLTDENLCVAYSEFIEEIVGFCIVDSRNNFVK
ncbi:hypothetical protein B1R32_1301 [Abditibacterium utsteinense]|uniref:Uncharacterized protein n=1 Tax=Abditibacterium utsteinense TaxID=1960156 RepID=A0A2S8SNY8_9BACT|nr:hypothetical protein B1R32_1301 [Abditibacterium utsteinense]